MKKIEVGSKKIGLALGGGAMRGAAIFGVMEELEKSGLEFSHVAGTSAGAIIGAFYALHGETWSFKEELKAFTKKDWLKLVEIYVLLRVFVKFTGEKLGFVLRLTQEIKTEVTEKEEMKYENRRNISRIRNGSSSYWWRLRSLV